MTELVRLFALFIALVCSFFGTYYILTGDWKTGIWAAISGILLMFIREFIVIDDYEDDDLT